MTDIDDHQKFFLRFCTLPDVLSRCRNSRGGRYLRYVRRTAFAVPILIRFEKQKLYLKRLLIGSKRI
jgi:hypothetical protein